MTKHVNDNDSSRNGISWNNDIEILGYDPRLTIRAVTFEVLQDEQFLQDGCNIISEIIRDIAWRKMLDHFLMVWANWKGTFVDADGQEVIFDDVALAAVPEEWMRDNFLCRLPNDPALRVRKENIERLCAVLSIAKIIKPANMAMAGKRPANDND